MFYNSIPFPVACKHKDFKKPSQAFYKEENNEVLRDIFTGGKRSLCLNPIEKDEDFLEISFFVACKNDKQIKVVITYEMDSMERFFVIKHDLFEAPLKIAVVTTLSGNMRFVHLMKNEEY